MTNSPKNPKISKKSKICQKSQNLPKNQNWLFWPIFLFIFLFLAFWEKFGFYVAYIGGTYRVQKSDLDDSVEGTKKAM
jgi:hypothetical protein